MALLSTTLLDSFVGKSIEDICPLGFGKIGDSENHCAHFVGHVLKLTSAVVQGLTCAGMVSAGKKHPQAGAVIRVNNIFNCCENIAQPASLGLGCLAYYTVKSNIAKSGLMGDMSHKHVGICFGGYVYNYGNKLDKVRKDKVGDLKSLYGHDTITLYTVLPAGYAALTLEEIRALVAD